MFACAFPPHLKEACGRKLRDKALLKQGKGRNVTTCNDKLALGNLVHTQMNSCLPNTLY